MGPFRNIVLKLWFLVLGPAVGLRVIQSPSVLSLLRGQTARINCTLLPGEERVDSVRYYWYRTRDNPGIRGNETKNFLNQSSRVSVSEGSLVIREVIVKDSDTYHCLVLKETPRPGRTLTGEETELNIQAEPQVYLSADPENEVAGIQTLICVAVGFFPRDLNISWIVEGNVSHQTEQGSPTVNSDGTYNLSSRLWIRDTHWDRGTVVTCQVQHVTVLGSVRKKISHSGGFPKYYYYFSLLSLILVAPFCLWIIKSQCNKLKNGKDSSIHDKNVDGQIMGTLVNASVNEGNVSASNESLHYAFVQFNHPLKRKQKQELKRPQQDQATEYAVLKVKDKNNPFYEESVHYSTVGICPTSKRTQTANYNATIYVSLKH
ncbi:immunoglobulin kappa light chain-like isoform X1 [Heptranchias perlo]|uniref:immunoglobulin kappa light chain-like isoform X1 n=1 Tax=Heptranchias perlo TaxID=212740 RepID=UPI00355A860C